MKSRLCKIFDDLVGDIHEDFPRDCTYLTLVLVIYPPLFRSQRIISSNNCSYGVKGKYCTEKESLSEGLELMCISC